ncbi:molybdopterin-dependent oxidoreductase [Pseudonocardia xishanensis]|uniref:Molybdopterin-dependent oxidoreductase n=1 Tax=Pseudonocardia xishanensis TaxID=630995 RepID=A0ABP8RIP2_9PSEU
MTTSESTEAERRPRADRAVGEWHKTACSLCYVNCGLEVQIEGHRITRIRGDKENERTKGYVCQKAQRMTFYGDHADRLTTPLRRRPDGTHEPISWEEALTEIAARLHEIRDADSAAGRPGSFALVGGGGQGNHSEGPYGHALMKWMNATRFFNPLSQEKTGDFWVNAKLFGGDTCHTAEDVEECDLLVVLGCNPWLAHGFNRARNEVNSIKNDPSRAMIVLDPRRTETAAVADVHLALRPGTDAYLLGAMLALILERGGADERFLAEHCDGYEDVAATLRKIPVDTWIAHAEVDRADVDRAVDLILASERMTVRAELGIQQGRNSTLNSYLEKLLYLLTGNFGRAGTNALHSWLIPLWGESYAPERMRSEITGFEYIGGLLPVSTVAEELDAGHPNHVRVLWVDSSNPANTVADTVAMEQAIRECELSVVIDVAYTETAALAEYVLPAAAQNEKWEYTYFNWEFPVNYFNLRKPLFEPLPGTMPEGDIYWRLFEKLGVMPDEKTLESLRDAARRDRPGFMKALGPVVGADPDRAKAAAVIMYATLGQTLPEGAATACVLWTGCRMAAKMMPVQVQRALHTEVAGPELGELLFDHLLRHPIGTAFSVHEYNEVWELVRHNRVQLAVPELLEWLSELDPSSHTVDPEYPLSLVNGQRRSHNANQVMRTPAWRKTDPDGALRVRTDDLGTIGAADGDWVAVVSPKGRVVARAEIDDSLRPAQVALPHGYGIYYPDGKGGRVLNGPRINILTDALDRDRIAGTPHHKDMPVRIETATSEEAEAAQRDSLLVRAIIEEGNERKRART